jgi:two-component system chemotaxis response regulator CheY
MTASAPATPIRVLVADDSGDSRQLLVRILREFVHADVVEARTGSDAWAHYMRMAPHMTFLDIDMPGRSGIEILGDIRRADSNAFVVMISGMSATANVMEAITLGACGFVVKPYAPIRILGVLEKYAAERGDAGLIRNPSTDEADFQRRPTQA